MTLPLQTWRVSALYNFVPVGANCTVPEILAAIHNMLVAEAGLGSLWVESFYDAGNGLLEIKRGGPQTGIRQTFRALLFGNVASTPATGTVSNNGVTASLGYVYGCHSNTANTTGPTNSPYSTTPYAGNYSGAGIICQAQTITKAANPFVFMAECDAGFIIQVGDNAGSCTFLAGALVENLFTNTELFVSGGSGSTKQNQADQAAVNSSSGHPVNGQLTGSTGLAPWMFYDDGTNKRSIGRMELNSQGVSGSDVMQAPGVNWTLHPFTLVHWINATISTTQFLGVMRQIKFGPNSQNRVQFKDGAGNHQSYSITSGAGTVRAGIHLDSVA